MTNTCRYKTVLCSYLWCIFYTQRVTFEHSVTMGVNDSCLRACPCPCPSPCPSPCPCPSPSSSCFCCCFCSCPLYQCCTSRRQLVLLLWPNHIIVISPVSLFLFFLLLFMVTLMTLIMNETSLVWMTFCMLRAYTSLSCVNDILSSNHATQNRDNRHHGCPSLFIFLVRFFLLFSIVFI